MGRFNQRITIRTQFTWVIFAAILLSLLIGASISLYIKAKDLKQQHYRDASTIAQVLSQDLTRVLLLKELDYINDMVQKISAFGEITNASLISSDGTNILNFTRTGFGQVDFSDPSNRTNNKPDLQYITTTISYSGQTYGKAFFYFRNTSFNQQFTLFLKNLLFIAPGLLFLSFLISLLAQNYFTRPIRELSQAVNALKMGNTLVLKDSYAHSKEMTDLFHGFRDMADKISNATRLIADQKERLHVMLESIADGVIATDIDNTITYLNPAAEHILNIEKEHAIQKHAIEIFPLKTGNKEETIDTILDETIITGNIHINLEDATVTTKHDELIPVHSTVSPIRDENGTISGTIIVFQNVSEARELADQLYHQATHDPLTGLMNRAEFEHRLHKLLSETDGNTNHVLMYLDLDQFKLVNDTSGHTAGDALLIQLAGKFTGLLRDKDLVARLGGDEFAILLDSCELERACTIAKNIIEKFNQFIFIWEDRQFKIGVSIGLVPVNQGHLSVDDALRDADLACYVAKDTGRNRVHVYRTADTLTAKRHNEIQWATIIREAIDNNQLCLQAQHIRAMDRENKISHIEVLVRYMDPDKKIYLPGEFLPAVERYGVAPLLDRWVIKSVLGNESIVQKLKSNRNIRVNINLSGNTLNEPDLVDYVAEMLEGAQLPPRTICFEITETAAVTNLSATAHFMKKMRLLGCEFALDDFGSGVSSFAYLKNLPIDYLKIDGSFVKDIDSNLINRAMVSAINDIGHVMKIKTIAEYVTNPTVCEVLQTMDIDFAQGFFVHSPCPITEIFENLQSTSTLEVCTRAG